jgi:hypothetical protein
MDEAVKAFNSAFRKLKDDGKVERIRGDKDLLRHILFQAYSRVVSPEVDMLKGKRMFRIYIHTLNVITIITGLFQLGLPISSYFLCVQLHPRPTEKFYSRLLMTS